LLVSAARAQQVAHVFYIALENHNWTQPASYGGPQQLYGGRDKVSAAVLIFKGL